MRFRNAGESVQVRLKENGGYKWELLKTGETIDLPEEVGLAYGFEKSTTQGKIGEKIVETKQFDSKRFFEELKNIKGIGSKTAKDIVVWGTKEKLIETIKFNTDLPFRDDVTEKLKEKYGRQS